MKKHLVRDSIGAVVIFLLGLTLGAPTMFFGSLSLITIILTLFTLWKLKKTYPKLIAFTRMAMMVSILGELFATGMGFTSGAVFNSLKFDAILIVSLIWALLSYKVISELETLVESKKEINWVSYKKQVIAILGLTAASFLFV